ncbi:MAG: zinc ABC transporter substrate-binding protein [Alistipes sp.]|nr:zinc ABC transporter substrate-binding protein [Alistipes sp.]
MKKNRKTLLLAALFIIIVVALATVFILYGQRASSSTINTNRELTVSIPPIKYLVDRITGGEIPVNVILPAGSSPETYEPTPKQLKDLERSPVIFVTGLIDFENSLAGKTATAGTLTVPLHSGILLIEGECGTHHHHENGHTHSHGVDPHIWASPACLKWMAANIYNNLPVEYLKNDYIANYERLISDIEILDDTIRSILTESGVTAFLIYHPALTYYARDYGLEQIQLEQDGKEPSVDKLIRTISDAKTAGLNKILYQKEFSIKAVETAAKDIGAVPVVIDPLDENIFENLLTITNIIAGNE